ncbi:putative bifunctional diguanylate cyclase/phosphodiesterase [Kaistia adipata]|uniref:putative bifunctional diguanylate cyclase/phosphodiesterase n=1 Tax=Kaistia adipata TaxID=166954 RepID=UPI000428DC48|nr:GGDEF and EAL domain-containing protein [Kaistia adipata]
MPSPLATGLRKGRLVPDNRGSAADLTSPRNPTDAILAGIGAIAYRWTRAGDRLEWAGDVASLLGLDAGVPVATGAAFAALLDAASQRSRQDCLKSGTDTGAGVPYQVEYALRPAGPAGPPVWIEDVGRWYAEGNDGPCRAEGILRIVNERHARDQRLAFLSHYDEVTGLYNRSGLLDILDRTIEGTRRDGGSAAFLLISIDSFNLINNAFGYRAGDRVLAAVARRLRSRLREGDVMGRFSGHKLGLVLMNCDETDMTFAAERFLSAIREDVIATAEGTVSVTVSIGGIALPQDATDRELAMERVQDSLGRARKAGRGRFVGYAPSPEHETERRANIALSQQLIGALSDQRLRLAFQPVVDVTSRSPVFHEALLRLARPDGSIASAGQIVPIAERLGLSRLFDLAVLDRVLETLARHPEARLSLNLTPETATGPDWLAKFAKFVGAHPDLGGRLIVEITETSAIRNLNETAYFVAALHDLGARFAIDDFGAGFTSFRNLRALSVDMVKIDGSFIEALPTSPDDQIFVRRLIELARDLGIETVAEFVQDEATATLLARWGVDRIQGHLCGEARLAEPWG